MLKIFVISAIYLYIVFGENVIPRQVGEIEAVRLVGGANERSGRLEVRSRGVWGGVCDDGFNNRAARVVCRSLGLTNGSESVVSAGSAVISRSYFGGAPRGMRVLLDEVTCQGTEASLNECNHRPVGTSNCFSWENVGIFCGPVEIDAVRLSGHRNPRGGRVEVMIHGAWGNVRSPHFGSTAANVICRSLGYNDTGHAVPSRDFFAQPNQLVPILLEDLQCHGNETSLNECDRELFLDNEIDTFTEHNYDVAVVCGERFDPIVTQIRLVDGLTSREGTLEVFVNGTWGNVCRDSFNDAAARVVCKMLGLRSSWTILDRTETLSGIGPIHLDDVVCSGSESTLNNCRFNTINNCQHLQDVGLRCR